ncbi:hypothetical protein [Polynucleobacter sp. MWH-Braz-FAM2G]|uniref:hypothetical protein n=1 Tax=Polynucleobacter sp. MWH-Braz-FAM2G TaxID=1855883 RepID=UPI001BFE9F54|nr:hypothetical protein [Polynucleobacter sp. MWH-Braz-FAM2G]QWD91772.1 hypothetical protein FD973_05520 [Polynucleobacter sp. MWH-Braz-FAM2G]
MSWKFWENKPRSNVKVKPISSEPLGGADVIRAIFSQISLPRDLKEANIFLFSAFFNPAPPFDMTVNPDNSLNPEIVELANTSGKVLQLWKWFESVDEKFGSVAGQMVRDDWYALGDKLDQMGEPANSGFRDAIQHYLVFINESITAFMEKPEKDKAIVTKDGTSLPIPWAYFLAMKFLVLDSSSPFSHKTGKEIDGEDWQLAETLVYSMEVATEAFNLILAKLDSFNPDKLMHWEFHQEDAGPFEAHLIRRHNNPLFEPDRQEVNAADVYQARIKDLEIYADVHSKIKAVKKVIFDDEITAEYEANLNTCREILEDCIDEAQDMGKYGLPLYEVATMMRADVLGIWRTAKKDNPEVIKLLDEAEEVYKNQDFRSKPELICLISGKSMPPEDIIPTILSLSKDEVKKGVEFFSKHDDMRKVLNDVRTGCLDVARAAFKRGAKRDDLSEKLEIIGVSL